MKRHLISLASTAGSSIPVLYLDFDFVGTIDYELPRRKEIRMSSSVVFSTNYLPVSIIESQRTGKTGVKLGIHQINYYNDRRCNR